MKLKNLLKLKIHKRIIRFFYENPASVDTPRGIATWINYDLKKVRAVLKKLANSGILIAHRSSSTTGYSFTRNKKTINQIRKLLKEKK